MIRIQANLWTSSAPKVFCTDSHRWSEHISNTEDITEIIGALRVYSCRQIVIHCCCGWVTKTRETRKENQTPVNALSKMSRLWIHSLNLFKALSKAAITSLFYLSKGRCSAEPPCECCLFTQYEKHTGDPTKGPSYAPVQSLPTMLHWEPLFFYRSA